MKYKFSLYRDPTVEFPPDMCSRVTFVNFTVTRSSLQSQCLHRVLKAERPDIDTKRSDLLKLQGLLFFTAATNKYYTNSCLESELSKSFHDPPKFEADLAILITFGVILFVQVNSTSACVNWKSPYCKH